MAREGEEIRLLDYRIETELMEINEVREDIKRKIQEALALEFTAINYGVCASTLRRVDALFETLPIAAADDETSPPPTYADELGLEFLIRLWDLQILHQSDLPPCRSSDLQD